MASSVWSAARRSPLSVQRPAPGHSEQDPHAWWQAMLERHRLRWAATTPRPCRRSQGIGLSGQMHGAVLLDDAGAVLRPAILWNDVRAAAECAELEAGFPDSPAVTGNIAMPGFTAPKLLWVRRHEPDGVRAACARCCCPRPMSAIG